MNYRYVANQLALLLGILGAVLFVVAGLGALFERVATGGVDPDGMLAILFTALGGVVVGGGVFLSTRKGSRHLGRREAMLLVAASWILGAAYCGLPFFLWAHLSDGAFAAGHAFRNVADCYFEAMSGLTTTGATILVDIDKLPRTLLLWRALTHWMGGLGIVVLFVAVLPSLGVGGKKLFRVEAPGPTQGGLRPNIRETARVLLWIYLAFTAIATASLWAAGMSFFDAVCHGLSVVSTGGFSTLDSSIAGFESVVIEILITLFMLVAGINFALFYQMILGRTRSALRDPELRVYLILKVVGILIVTINIMTAGRPIATTVPGEAFDPSLGQSLRAAAFVNIAMQTGTGFCTADYDMWPYLSRTLLIGLMIIGGCAGSTAGGVKVIRFWITLKVIAGELEKAFRPNVVRPVKITGGAVDPDAKLSSVVYTLGIILLLALGAVLLGVLEPPEHRDITMMITASMACLCNVGPGLGGVGATQNYALFTDVSKLLLSLFMALGRLEVFAIIVLFTPRFWRAD